MLRVENVSKTVTNESNELNILKNISFHISEGEFVAIMGASGCGKSTLLSILAGIDTASSGKIIIEKKNICELSDKKLINFRNQNIGIVFQSFNLIPALTVKENVMLPVALSEKKLYMEENVKKMLELVGMKDKANLKPKQISGGEQQRVAIARALVCQPKILLADEPTGALDSENSELVMKLFCKLNKELGMTIIMVTHSKEMSMYCDRTLYMKDGKLISD